MTFELHLFLIKLFNSFIQFLLTLSFFINNFTIYNFLLILLLTLSAHVLEGYSSHFVCLLVCQWLSSKTADF